MSKKDRIKIQDEISQSVRKFLKRRKDEPQSFRSGGMKKMLIGGLLTKGIKGAAKRYFKSGRKTSEIVKKEGGTRAEAKKGVRSGIRDELKSDFRVVDKKFQADKNNQLIAKEEGVWIKRWVWPCGFKNSPLMIQCASKIQGEESPRRCISLE